MLAEKKKKTAILNEREKILEDYKRILKLTMAKEIISTDMTHVPKLN